MTLRALGLILSIVSLSAFACEKQPPAADPDVAEQKIRDMVKQWNASLVAHDDSSIAELYAPDARLLPPYEGQVIGPTAIREYFAALWPLKANLVFTTIGIKVAESGELAVEEGNWAITIPGMVDTVTDGGKYLVTWVRKGDDWKVYQDIWNSSKPPQGMMPDTTHATDSATMP
ncbi:MAG: nuclear transport factor 2 family protein [Gemmatimonadota bacterium]